MTENKVTIEIKGGAKTLGNIGNTATALSNADAVNIKNSLVSLASGISTLKVSLNDFDHNTLLKNLNKRFAGTTKVFERFAQVDANHIKDVFSEFSNGINSITTIDSNTFSKLTQVKSTFKRIGETFEKINKADIADAVEKITKSSEAAIAAEERAYQKRQEMYAKTREEKLKEKTWWFDQLLHGHVFKAMFGGTDDGGAGIKDYIIAFTDAFKYSYGEAFKEIIVRIKIIAKTYKRGFDSLKGSAIKLFKNISDNVTNLSKSTLSILKKAAVPFISIGSGIAYITGKVYEGFSEAFSETRKVLSNYIKFFRSLRISDKFKKKVQDKAIDANNIIVGIINKIFKVVSKVIEPIWNVMSMVGSTVAFISKQVYEGLRDAFNETKKLLSSGLKALGSSAFVKGMKSLLVGLKDTFVYLFGRTFESIGDAVKTTVTTKINPNIKGSLSEIKNKMSGFFKSKIDPVTKKVNKHLDVFKKVGKSILGDGKFIVKPLQGVFGKFVKRFTDNIRKITGTGDGKKHAGLFSGFKSTLAGAFKGMVIGGILNLIMSIISKIINFVKMMILGPFKIAMNFAKKVVGFLKQAINSAETFKNLIDMSFKPFTILFTLMFAPAIMKLAPIMTSMINEVVKHKDDIKGIGEKIGKLISNILNGGKTFGFSLETAFLHINAFLDRAIEISSGSESSIRKLGSVIALAIRYLGEFFKGDIGRKIIGDLLDSSALIFKSLAETIAGVVGANLGKIVGAATVGLGTIGSVVTTFISNATQHFEHFFEDLTETHEWVSKKKSTIDKYIEEDIPKIKAGMKELYDKYKDELPDDIKTQLETMIDKMKTSVDTGFDNLILRFLDGIGKLFPIVVMSMAHAIASGIADITKGNPFLSGIHEWAEGGVKATKESLLRLSMGNEEYDKKYNSDEKQVARIEEEVKTSLDSMESYHMQYNDKIISGLHILDSRLDQSRLVVDSMGVVIGKTSMSAKDSLGRLRDDADVAHTYVVALSESDKKRLQENQKDLVIANMSIEEMVTITAGNTYNAIKTSCDNITAVVNSLPEIKVPNTYGLSTVPQSFFYKKAYQKLDNNLPTYFLDAGRMLDNYGRINNNNNSTTNYNNNNNSTSTFNFNSTNINVNEIMNSIRAFAST